MSGRDFTQAKLKEVLVYDSEDGSFRWADSVKRSRWVSPGEKAGFIDSKGYAKVGLFGRAHLAHRLAWLYVHGTWPEGWMDHIDGDRQNNRIANLRLADPAQNAQNRKRPANNSSGCTGVHYSAKNKVWVAMIRAKGFPAWAREFKDKESAIAARLKAKEMFHEFSPNQRF